MGAQVRGNGFDLLRICAALGVLVSHAFALVGRVEPRIPYGESLGGFAVDVFFAISGYLVAASWQRDPHVGRFLVRRALRIFPGLIAATLFTAFVVGGLATQFSVKAYFSSAEVFEFIRDMSVLKPHDALPGVFETNPAPRLVNGSLWSLKYEVAMYLILALLGWVLWRIKPLLAALASLILVLGAAAWYVYAELHGMQELSWPLVWRLDPAQLGYHYNSVRFLNLAVYFFMGAALFQLAERVQWSWAVAAGLVALTIWLPSEAWRHMASWAAVPYCCVLLASRAPAWARGWGRFDYSYGIYVYAWPIQQLVVHWFWPQWHFGAVLSVSMMATICMGALSWYLVERPSLRLKPAALRPVA